jgi:8-oxo-dGTP pyrophosphatase MutT (NUDIX family)
MSAEVGTAGEALADPFSAPGFATLARGRLDPLAAEGWAAAQTIGGDHQLDDARAFHPDPAALRAAAVLVPVVAREGGATVLLTERAHGLRMHSGQIAFPGGRIDTGDASPLAAALRESFEEIGLAPELISPLGTLDPYLTSTGFNVTPIVALVAPSLSLCLNPAEVADVFEAPLAFLMDPAHHEVHTRDWNGRQRRYYAMPWQGRYIWGATAGMLRRLYERVYA